MIHKIWNHRVLLSMFLHSLHAWALNQHDSCYDPQIFPIHSPWSPYHPHPIPWYLSHSSWAIPDRSWRSAKSMESNSTHQPGPADIRYLGQGRRTDLDDAAALIKAGTPRKPYSRLTPPRTSSTTRAWEKRWICSSASWSINSFLTSKYTWSGAPRAPAKTYKISKTYKNSYKI